MTALLLLSGFSACVLFDDGGGRRCNFAAIAPAPVRNPTTLLCEARDTSCPPGCPCPETTADLAPPVTWGSCGSPCEALGEAQCAADPSCRIVKQASCAVSGTCTTDYIGCFPTDNAADSSVDCAFADAETCSRSNECTAFHEFEVCPFDAECARPFAMCLREGQDPGRCFEPALCPTLPPPCRPGTHAGVANGCWTGACIPEDICEAVADN
ncbi:MAG: hypothetical protein KF773_06250 [Deltaproteobacteria bacterium]|nr:hypothetical protein [Deltaproteobacteria bacterium]